VDWAAARPSAAPDEAEGLRERKKAQTRQLLSDTATRMFLDRGRFGELLAATPALRAYQQETMASLVALAAGLLADRIGGRAGDPEPQIAAAALVGLWGVHFTALKKYLGRGLTPAGVRDAVTADVAAAAGVLRAGLGPFTAAAGTAATKDG
jgi:hypothetical protein